MRRAVAMWAVLGVVAVLIGLMGCGGMNEATGPGVDTAAKPPPPPPPSTPSKIAFERYMGDTGKQGGTWQIFTINTDGTGARQLTSGAYINQKPSWAPDGRLAFTSNRDGQRRIYTMNSDGSGQTAVTSPPTGNPGDNGPNWCLGDAGKIVFLRNRSGTSLYSDLWMVKAGNETQLTTSPREDDWPSFSPDGRFVVFNRRFTDGDSGQLHVAGVASPVVVWPLAWAGTPLAGTHPDWSPNGTSVLYYNYAELWRVPVNPATGEATGPPQQLTSDGTAVSEYHPTWSPLQDYITYWTNPGVRVVTRKLDTGVVRDLTSGRYPDWSPAVF